MADAVSTLPDTWEKSDVWHRIFRTGGCRFAALIFIGSQRLPEFLRQFRDFSPKMHELSQSVSHAMDEVARMAQSDDLKKEKRQIDPLLAGGEHDKNPLS